MQALFPPYFWVIGPGQGIDPRTPQNRTFIIVSTQEPFRNNEYISDRFVLAPHAGHGISMFYFSVTVELHLQEYLCLTYFFFNTAGDGPEFLETQANYVEILFQFRFKGERVTGVAEIKDI